MVTPFCAHDFYDRVIVVATCWVDGDTGWLIYNDHIVVLVNYSYGLSGHRRLVSVQGMGDYVSILDNGIDVWDLLAIDHNISTFYSVFLDLVSSIIALGDGPQYLT